MQQSLFSRVKRQANSVKTGDLEQFRSRDKAYQNFIDELKSVLTEPNEIYGNIRVTKRRDGITKVNIKDGANQVGFIYRNRDLYIIGFVTGSTFYIDKEVHDGLGKKIPSAWTTVIGTSKVETLSNPFSYGQILPSGENTVLQIGKLGDSLNKLTQVGDTSKRSQIMTQHLGPFVVAFSEAIRFPVVAREIQGAIRQSTGTVRLSKNILEPLSIGHPDERCNQFSLSIYELLLNWGKLSDRVPLVYAIGSDGAPPLRESDCILRLEKNQLNTLLGVANSHRFDRINTAPVRGKRDLTIMFDNTIPQHPALLEQQINGIDYEQSLPMSAPCGTTSITHSPDVIGALHLLTVGLLYLYGRKMNVAVGENRRTLDSREAYGLAADLADRIGCFFRFAGLELEIGFEEEMHLQRQLSSAILHGESVEPILTELLYQHYSKLENAGSLEALRQLLFKALASESGLVKGDAFLGDVCFPGSESTA
ncbi:uncharacterized protein LOC135709707 [Ochlerotatus camptorhynchus]|uniref:uncharacterized protein LOC135709707 n=1 Tax=Ochlerotatus camptorhynchus TaxID=644619 RepID=UPI0031E2A073